MEPVLPVLPELVRLAGRPRIRPRSPAAARRPRRTAPSAPRPPPPARGGRHDVALPRRAGRELRAVGPGGEVRVGVADRHARDPALDPHLAAELVPVEAERGPRVVAPAPALCGSGSRCRRGSRSRRPTSAARSAPTAGRPAWRWPARPRPAGPRRLRAPPRTRRETAAAGPGRGRLAGAVGRGADRCSRA